MLLFYFIFSKWVKELFFWALDLEGQTSYGSTQGNFLSLLRFFASPLLRPTPALDSGARDLAPVSRAWIQPLGPGSHPQALALAPGSWLQSPDPSPSPWIQPMKGPQGGLRLWPGHWSQGTWARAMAWGLGGGGEAEKHRSRENCPVWIHRTSAPPDSMPHLLYSKQQQ